MYGVLCDEPLVACQPGPSVTTGMGLVTEAGTGRPGSHLHSLFSRGLPGCQHTQRPCALDCSPDSDVTFT